MQVAIARLARLGCAGCGVQLSSGPSHMSTCCTGCSRLKLDSSSKCFECISSTLEAVHISASVYAIVRDIFDGICGWKV